MSRTWIYKVWINQTLPPVIPQMNFQKIWSHLWKGFKDKFVMIVTSCHYWGYLRTDPPTSINKSIQSDILFSKSFYKCRLFNKVCYLTLFTSLFNGVKRRGKGWQTCPKTNNNWPIRCVQYSPVILKNYSLICVTSRLVFYLLLKAADCLRNQRKVAKP